MNLLSKKEVLTDVCLLWLIGGFINPALYKIVPSVIVKPGTFTVALLVVLYQYHQQVELRSRTVTLIRENLIPTVLSGFFVSVAFLTSLWSDLPLITIKYSLTLFGTILVSIYIACRYSLTQLTTLVLLTLCPLLVASIIVCLSLPEIGVMSSPRFHELHHGRWMGIFAHKNWLGLYTGLSSVILTSTILTRTLSLSTLTGAMFLLCVSTVLLTQAESTTALVAYICCIFLLSVSVALPAVKYATDKIMVRNFMLVIFAPLMIAVLTSESELLRGIQLVDNSHASSQEYTRPGFKRTTSVSGRAAHWNLVAEKISEKPMLGYGYETFWHSDEADSVHVANQWIANQAHSGWLDMVLDFGIPLTLILAGAMLYLLTKLIYIWLIRGDTRYAIATLIVVFLYLENTTESLLPNNSGLPFLLLVAITFIIRNDKNWFITHNVLPKQISGKQTTRLT